MFLLFAKRERGQNFVFLPLLCRCGRRQQEKRTSPSENSRFQFICQRTCEKVIAQKKRGIHELETVMMMIFRFHFDGGKTDKASCLKRVDERI